MHKTLRDVGSIPGLGRCPRKGNGNPLQYSCLENPMDRGAWLAAVHRVVQSWTRLKRLSSSSKDISVDEGGCLISFSAFCALDFCVLTIYLSTATVLCKAYRGGHLTIRLALGGCTNRPFYRIVAAHNKCPRDGRFVEQLGSYDPMPNSHGEKLVALNLDRIRHWIGCGAHLSKPVEKLLGNSATLTSLRGF